MKRLIGLTGSLLLLFLMFSAIILPSFRRNGANAAGAQNTQPMYTPAATQTEDHKFILKDSDGWVAAFRAGEDKPFFVIFTRVADLPESDRSSLKEGIKAETRQQLGQLLEDYCS